MPGNIVTFVVLGALLLFVITALYRTVRIVPQQTAVIIERLGSYSRTLDDGMHILVPFIDKPRATIDLREQVVTFPPQPVITSDNLVVSIDTVIYYTVTDAKSAVYEIANFIQGIEQLTVTTLRNVIGSLDLEETLTSRDQINGQLRGVLDQETGRWGIRVNRVELKAIDPPHSVQDSMEKQMRQQGIHRQGEVRAGATGARGGPRQPAVRHRRRAGPRRIARKIPGPQPLPDPQGHGKAATGHGGQGAADWRLRQRHRRAPDQRAFRAAAGTGTGPAQPAADAEGARDSLRGHHRLRPAPGALAGIGAGGALNQAPTCVRSRESRPNAA